MFQQPRKRTVVVVAVLACLGGAFIMSNSPFPSQADGGNNAENAPPSRLLDQKTPLSDTIPPKNVKLERATFGGGCFWCTEAVYQELQGVYRVTSGYSGGELKNPTYEDIGTGRTGHAEVIQIEFDPAQVTFPELLEVFWKTHDPTTLNRQGADIGTQYRSVVFFHNSEQKQQAVQIKQQLDAAQAFPDPIVTEITPFKKFYLAEDYHQNYFVLNGDQGYCRAVIRPKVDKFRKVFADKLKSSNPSATVPSQRSLVKNGSKIDWSQVDWKAKLTPLQYEVTREQGTERAYENKYWNNYRVGVYECVCCGLPLFHSEAKFKSETGWPSFFQPINRESIGEKEDRNLSSARTETHCSRCQAHLGHVFPDGPKPTGLRYCMNSASLNFVEETTENAVKDPS